MLKERNSFVDILKCIGIISIVIGHCCSYKIPFINVSLIKFVYSYHIMLFIFIVGYCFNEKNSKNYDKYIFKKIYTVFKWIIIYNLIFILLHNIFIKIGIIDSSYYTLRVMIEKIINAISLNTGETLLGTFWFMSWYLICSIAFCVLFKITENKSKKNLLRIIISIIFGILGLIICKKNFSLTYHAQSVFLAIPIMFFGYYFKIDFEKLKKYINLYTFSIISIIFLILLYYSKNTIDISFNIVGNIFLFYPLTIFGILFCIFLAYYIDKLKNKKIFTNIGKNSIHIMALHFLAFKMVDLVANLCFYKKSVDILNRFPHSFDFNIIYILAGVFIPLIIVFIVKLVITKIKNCNLMKKIFI